jgi:predicted DNA-binding ArsR family transcriptional regulator
VWLLYKIKVQKQMGSDRTAGGIMKKKYQVLYNNEVIGTRKSERDYTHAVVIIYIDGTKKVESYSNGLERALKVARTTQNYVSNRCKIIPTVEVLPVQVV